MSLAQDLHACPTAMLGTSCGRPSSGAGVGMSKIIWPLNVTEPDVGSGSGRSMTLPRVVLPQPDSPTRPSVSPRADVEEHAVDGPHGADLADAQHAAPDLEVLDDLADADERRSSPSAAAFAADVDRGRRGGRRTSPGVASLVAGMSLVPRSGRPGVAAGAAVPMVRPPTACGARPRAPRRPPGRRVRPLGGSPSGVSQQRERCPSDATVRNGGAVSQIGIAYGQRRLNRQPVGQVERVRARRPG